MKYQATAVVTRTRAYTIGNRSCRKNCPDNRAAAVARITSDKNQENQILEEKQKSVVMKRKMP